MQYRYGFDKSVMYVILLESAILIFLFSFWGEVEKKYLKGWIEYFEVLLHFNNHKATTNTIIFGRI